MFIRWQRRGRTCYRSFLGDHTDVHWSAILCESKRVDGKPRQQHVAYVVGFDESLTKVPIQQVYVWERAREKLNAIGNRLAPAERKRIEASLAEKIGCQCPSVAKSKRMNDTAKRRTKALSKQAKQLLSF
jgi:hypothetical protein